MSRAYTVTARGKIEVPVSQHVCIHRSKQKHTDILKYITVEIHSGFTAYRGRRLK
jgi:hypothetical protein